MNWGMAGCGFKTLLIPCKLLIVTGHFSWEFPDVTSRDIGIYSKMIICLHKSRSNSLFDEWIIKIQLPCLGSSAVFSDESITWLLKYVMHYKNYDNKTLFSCKKLSGLVWNGSMVKKCNRWELGTAVRR